MILFLVRLQHLFFATRENWLIRYFCINLNVIYLECFAKAIWLLVANLELPLFPIHTIRAYIFICAYLANALFIQICHEVERFSTYLPDIKVAVFYGGVNIKVHKDLLKNECPHIVVGTPGRILALTRDKDLGLKNVRHFILDECDKMLESLGHFLPPCLLNLRVLPSVHMRFLIKFCFSYFLIYLPFDLCRHEKRCARDFQIDSPW